MRVYALDECSHAQLPPLSRFWVVYSVNKLCYRLSFAFWTSCVTYTHISCPTLFLLHPVQSLINFVCTVYYSALYMYITAGLLCIYIQIHLYIYYNGGSNSKYPSTRVRIKRVILLYKWLYCIYNDKVSYLRVSMRGLDKYCRNRRMKITLIYSMMMMMVVIEERWFLALERP
jgi:hypothetical protein